MELEIDAEELRKYSIFVGTPMFGGACSGMYTKSVADLAQFAGKYGVDIRFYYLFNESLIQRARNYVVDQFLRSGCSHLMFIDADIGFKSNDVISLMGLQIQNPDKYDILTGPYPKKSISWEKVKTAVENGKAENPYNLQFYTADYALNVVDKKSTTFRLNEPLEVSESGTGFMLIPRHVFEKYDTHYPEYSYIPDHSRTENFDGSREIMAYFDCEIDPDSRRYLSEDYFFCRNIRKIGVKLHTCPWLELMHVGSYNFKGSMPAIASIDAPLTSNKKSRPNSYKSLTKNKKRGKFRP